MKKSFEVALLIVLLLALPALAGGKNWKSDLKAGLETAFANAVLTISVDGLEGNTGRAVKKNEIYEGQVVQLVGGNAIPEFLLGKVLPLPRGTQVNVTGVNIKSNNAFSVAVTTTELVRGEQLKAEIFFSLKYLDSASVDEVRKAVEVILFPTPTTAQVK